MSAPVRNQHLIEESVRPTEHTPCAVGRTRTNSTDGNAFGRIPRAVLDDAKLTDRDKVLYAHLAASERRGTARVGLRELAFKLDSSVRSVRRNIEHLQKQKHVSVKQDHGKRAEYHLLSPVFEPKAKKQPAARKDEVKRVSAVVRAASNTSRSRQTLDEILAS